MFSLKNFLILAAVLGWIAFALTWHKLEHVEDEYRKDWVLVPVVVAIKDMEQGTVLEYDDLAKMKMPKQFLTHSIISPAEVDEVIGKKLNLPIHRGDLILRTYFRSPDVPNKTH